MQVVRERPSQRRYHRVRAPLFVQIDDGIHRAADWSLGGLCIKDFSGVLPEVGEEREYTLSLPFQGFEVVFSVDARVVRVVEAENTFAVEFTRIDQRERDLMGHFIEELIRGSMVPIEDTIQRIDTPVTPISTKPDINPTNQMPLRRWPIKTMVMSSAYIGSGLFILGYLLLILFANYFRLEINSAVVSVPVSVGVSQANGRVIRVDFQPGDYVERGDHVVWIEDPNHENKIDKAAFQIEKEFARLRRAEARLAGARKLWTGLATVRDDQLNSKSLRLQELRALARETDRTRLAMEEQAAKGEISRAEAQGAVQEHDRVLRQIELVEDEPDGSEQDNTRVLVRELARTELAVQIARMEADVIFAQETVSVSQRTLERLKLARSQYAIVAPFDGVLRSVEQLPGSIVTRGDPVAIFEQRSNTVIEAYLNQEEVMRVGLGDEALVFFPATDHRVSAKVSEVNRTAGFIEEQTAKYTWRGVKDRSARVMLTVDPEHADFQRLHAGLPAVVIFDRRSTNELVEGVGSGLKRIANAVFGGGAVAAPEAEAGE